MRMPVLKDCSVEGCQRCAHTKGMCLWHYRKARRAEKKAETPAPEPS
jgi:hypothetical protein